MEKGFNFYSDGKFYRYTCAVPNSENFDPVDKDTIRGDTIHNYGLMYRDPKTLKIHFTVVT